MATKKPASKKPTTAPKKASAKPAAAKPKEPKKPAPDPRGRLLGSRVEKIRERLSLGQIEEERKIVCDLWRVRAELDDKRKSAAADFRARMTEVDQKIKAALANAQSGHRDIEIEIEEWLTPSNAVQRYRRDTGEMIGDRQALAADLQESLPGIGDVTDADDKPSEDQTESDEDVTEAIVETVEAAKEAGDEPEVDFGGGE